MAKFKVELEICNRDNWRHSHMYSFFVRMPLEEAGEYCENVLTKAVESKCPIKITPDSSLCFGTMSVRRVR